MRRPRLTAIGMTALGGVLGGVAGGGVVVGVTVAIKTMFDAVSRESVAGVIVTPVVGLAIATFVLHVVGRNTGSPWRAFPPNAIRSDITSDVVESAGAEERFPWRLAPLRAAAIFATVGCGAAMGTEAPAAYLGVATGDWLADRRGWWRRLIRPAALAAGAAGVSGVMGAAPVGIAYMLELGRRNHAPISVERVIAAVLGGVIGWLINAALGIQLIRLIVPHVPPDGLLQAIKTALFVGVVAGVITAIAGVLIYRAKAWKASPAIHLVVGVAGTAVVALAIAALASPAVASGPGGGAILWAESVSPVPRVLLAIALLRAAATIAAVAAGGCGGVFVPFLAVGDIGGRVVAPALDISADLAGAAGAAAGIAGGYRLPVTAIAMSLGIGGPPAAVATCVVTAVVAAGVGALVERAGRALAHARILAAQPGHSSS